MIINTACGSIKYIDIYPFRVLHDASKPDRQSFVAIADNIASVKNAIKDRRGNCYHICKRDGFWQATCRGKE